MLKSGNIGAVNVIIQKTIKLPDSLSDYITILSV
jgi:hypothetical protein